MKKENGKLVTGRKGKWGNGNGEPTVPAKPDGFLIVGIGASAGGIQALREFFANVPPDSGVAYVVILHLSPDHDSRLAEVLQTTTSMPVTQVKESITVEPDHVYVVPPNQHLTMRDGSIAVSPNILVEERRAPVDIFFRTLADSHGPRAVAVVLSGTGADGSMGIKRVKEHGGAAFVQNPREAEFKEMPRNSIATDLIDDVLPIAKIPEKIIAYRKSIDRVEITPEPPERYEEQQQALRDVLSQLRLKTGHDFSNYKRPTLLRRIERRINVHDLPGLPSYAEIIRESADEAQALLKDLLISVTNFFRDREPFERLEHDVLPGIFSKKAPGEPIRMWCVGCATGEEAYTLAMLCAELTRNSYDAPKVQIFATDIDEQAIATAREGLYSLNDAADVSPERLQRFFTKEGEEYRVRREIREMVLFAHHNVMKDPAFSHLDLATCRNLLIYLNQKAKERVLETLHFALEPGGYLFLGTSESVDGSNDLFVPFSRSAHIYQSRETGARKFPVPESAASAGLENTAVRASRQENRTHDRMTYGDLHQRLLEQYASPSVIVNEEYDIAHLSEHAGRYLQVGGGEPSKNLLKMILPELRMELRSALYQAAHRKTNTETPALHIRVDNDTEVVKIHVRPVLREDDTARGFLLVLFETQNGSGPVEESTYEPPEPLARQLEEELIRVKSQLRSSVEQYEVQAEELKASNEELQAMNEELRSSAEELETSKEELQSINEELRTVNQELKIKIEETTLASNNLKNLITSSHMGTIFLDRGLRIQFFTPSVREIFNLIPADIGRPLSDITHSLDYQDLIHDAESVLKTLHVPDREIEIANGRHFLVRVVPYRTNDDRIDGVIVTFVDITRRKQAEDELRQQADELVRFNRAMMGREIRMIDLKREVNELAVRVGESPRYDMNFDEETGNDRSG
jgi:two-component system, chemotaxis family, CheB/CheR fusion protein